MIFQNEKYVYQGTIPLLNYLETKITIEEENQEKRVEYIESNQKLLNQVLQYKIYLCFENLDDNHIGVKRLRYYPQENNSSEMEKAKGETTGDERPGLMNFPFEGLTSGSKYGRAAA